MLREAGLEEEPLGTVWRALSDPTRRLIVDQLGGRPRTTSELCAMVPLSRFAVMKHLDVLVEAGLVVMKRRGRERWNYLNAAPLRQLYERWVHPRAGAWAASAARLERLMGVERETWSMNNSKKVAEPASLLDVLVRFTIAAPPDRVWRTMFDQPANWWPKDFNALSGSRMQFEERLGGRLCETTGAGGGLVWYTVMALEPGRSVDLVGHLTAKFGGPTTSLLRLELEPHGAGGTTFTLTDALHGRVGPGMAANVEAGWRALFEAGLGAYAEAAA